MDKQTLSFQAEVKQILHLVTHSLYSNKEIFLRELVSNASDACDKLRFEAIDHPQFLEDAPKLELRIFFDTEKRTLTIRDNGIGLSAEEAVSHLGTIAKSGTKEFMAKLEGDQKKDASMIGQFGVGFYSGFIVADRITVESRRAGLPAEQGVRWSSEGTGDFEVEEITRAARGTDVILHLRDGEDEFLRPWKLKSIISKYSDHISLPILMQKEEWNGETAEYKSQGRTGRRSTRPPRCGRAPRARSPTPSTPSSTSRSATTPTRRWPTRTTASRAAASTRSCCTSRPRRRSTCGTATSAAA